MIRSCVDEAITNEALNLGDALVSTTPADVVVMARVMSDDFGAGTGHGD